MITRWYSFRVSDQPEKDHVGESGGNSRISNCLQSASNGAAAGGVRKAYRPYSSTCPRNTPRRPVRSASRITVASSRSCRARQARAGQLLSRCRTDRPVWSRRARTGKRSPHRQRRKRGSDGRLGVSRRPDARASKLVFSAGGRQGALPSVVDTTRSPGLMPSRDAVPALSSRTATT